MVEGHSVHRVARRHRKRLVGKTFKARSPNGRFAEGAKAIDGKPFSGIEAIGKNLFAFFGEKDDPVVVHVHFGMSGAWAVYREGETVPEPTKTTRLRLEGSGMTADLSAMTVQHGDIGLYNRKRANLGDDPLRGDADPANLWSRVRKSKKSIGALVMDQSFFAGPGNIYRAEILFKAGVHPGKLGKDLVEGEFRLVWEHAVDLLRRGYETGSIVTVEPAEAAALGKPGLRRYVYNSSKCPRCNSPIKTWQIESRTRYACPRCQPMTESAEPAVLTPRKDCVPFNSHCAPVPVAMRLEESGPARLTVKELRAELSSLGIKFPSNLRKQGLIDLMIEARGPAPRFVSSEDAAMEKALAGESLAVGHVVELGPGQTRAVRSQALSASREARVPPARFVSSEDAAMEKALAGESLAVEHIAELGPGQARGARYQALSASGTRKRPAVVTPPRGKRRA